MTIESKNNPPPACEISDTDQNDLPSMNRRSFFTRTLLGGGAAIASGGVAIAASRASLDGSKRTNGIEVDETIFKPFDQRNGIFSFVFSEKLTQEVYPERISQYKELNNTDFDFWEGSSGFMKGYKPYANRPGYEQPDLAMMYAGWSIPNMTDILMSVRMQPNTSFHSWNQGFKSPVAHEFESDEQAATMVRSALRAFGATRVGITRADRRWDYEPMYDMINDQTLSWDKDFPFKPKSVIVVALPADYDCLATSPSWAASGVVGSGYTNMSIMCATAAQFIRGLGYSAVGAGNDLGNSVAYGIAAGMGEGGRNGQLIMPGIGPRARLCRIYTDLDFGDAYDEPRSWGITEFCKSCMKCAESCPSGALSMEVEPSFEPKYEHADVPGYTWNGQSGVKKWHSDSKKCFQFWVENEGSCANCIASCTFNEPNVWHHWLIMAVNPAMPKFVHALMAEAHPAFGYGGQGAAPKPEKLKKFWESGKGMRTNIKMKNNSGSVGQA